jgi:MFS family permease
VFPLPNDRNGQLSMSLLLAAGGLGTALGPIAARRLTGRDIPRIRWAIAASFVLGGFYYCCMAGAPNLGVVALFLLLARFHGAIIWVFSTVLLQMQVEDRFRGRVFAAENSLFTGAMMTASVLTTRALDLHLAGVPQAVLAAGIVSVLVGLLWVGRLSGRGAPAQESAGAAARLEPEEQR